MTFIDGVPVVLTCDDHRRGCKNYIIHPPRNPSVNLPSKYSDQLCHCCIRTRTIKPMKCSEYSTGFQMHEQRGTFHGIDTCNVTSYRNFNFRSTLLSNAESRSIINRPDINTLLNQMIEENAMTTFIANDKRNLAQKSFGNFDFQPYYYGATYVPLEYTILMKRDLIDSSIQVTVDDR